MRRTIFSILPLICAAFIAKADTPVDGIYTQKVDNIVWTFEIRSGEASVGGGSYTNTAVAVTTEGAVTIPQTLGGCPVTSIGDDAFYGCSELTAVVVPEGVLKIGAHSFDDCVSLQSVSLPEGLVQLGLINAFCGCESLETIDIPSTVTSIGDLAFQSCGLVSITIPSNVVSIGDGAFAGCTRLEQISLDNNANFTIRNGLLCSGDGKTVLACPGAFRSVDIPTDVTTLADHSFDRCPNLTGLVLPSSLETIGWGAISDCPISTLHIPENVSSIDGYQFGGCDSMTNFTVDADNLNFSVVNDLLCDKAGTGIVHCPRGVAEITVPSQITAICDGAFDYCSMLETVYVEKGDKERVKQLIENSGLGGGNPLGFSASYLEIGVKPDGKYTEEVDGVEWTYIVKDGKASIGGGAPRARAIDVETAGEIVIPSVLGGCPVTAIGDYAFNECAKITSVEIPMSVKSIGVQAFASCKALEFADIPAAVTNISKLAFYCSSIRSAVVPEGIESLADSLFYCCSDLSSVTLPSTLKNVGWGAFVSCHSLRSLDIPSTVTNFDNRAFSDCGLEGTFILPRDLVSMVPSSLEMCSSIESFAVEAGNVRYEASDGMLLDRWTQTLLKCPVPKSTARVPEGIAIIGEEAFRNCSNLAELDLPASLVGIEEEAFAYCKGLTEVDLPTGLASIGSYAFDGCTGLMSIGLPEGLEIIGRNAFSGCSSLTALSVPESVTNVGSSAFCNCSSLREMRIPLADGIVPDNLLSGCYCLTNATVPTGVTYLGYRVFANCSRLQSVIFEGDAPLTVRSGIYTGTSSNLTTIVSRGTTGWNGAGSTDLPAAWPVGDGYARGIRYAGPVLHAVTFDLGEHGSRVGGGELVQTITNGCAAIAPTIVADSGWKFNGWDRDFACVTEDLTVNALYEQLPSWIETEVVGGVEWTFIVSSDGTASVGGGSVRMPAVPTSLAGAVKIPAKLGGHDVTGLGKSAFENCKGIKSIDIPDGVTTVAGGAFRACTGLTNVTMTGSVRSLGTFAFCGCRSLAEVTLPEGVASIGVQTFSCCYGLKKVTLPETLTKIGADAFEKCRSITCATFAGDVPEGLADSGLIGSTATIYYPIAYRENYERVVPEDQRWYQSNALATTLKAASNGKDVVVSNTWAAQDLEKRFGIGKAAKYVARYGNDLVQSLFKETGKVSSDGKKMTVLDDFVAGTDPTDESSRLQAQVSVDANGVPHVTWTPDLNEGGQKSERVYRVLGATTLDGAWSEVEEGQTTEARFFKVSVELP